MTSSGDTQRIDGMNGSGFDVIGDVHGHADTLVALLTAMGYSHDGTAWRHPTRTVVFVGDLIDNGSNQIVTLDIVRSMIAAGSALATMGNHEFNAIAWHRGWRERSEKNHRQHEAFLAEAGDGSPLHCELVDWFTTLPLWLEPGGLRVVHACWDERSMVALAAHLTADTTLTDAGLRAAASRGTAEYDAVEILVKGPEVPLPDGLGYD